MFVPSSQPPRPKIRLRTGPLVALRPGDILAGFAKIERFVREDRAGVHFIGRTLKDDAAVDILVMSASGEDATEAGVRFLAAARKSAALRSKFAARALHAGVTPDGLPFVVSEHMSNKTLTATLREHPSVSTEQAVCVALDVCHALAEAHARGLVHGGVSTDEIHLAWTKDGPSEVKLVGIGVPSAAQAFAFADRTTLPAPELLLADRAPDARSDVWGVGVVLYTMLADAPPFAADTPSGTELAVKAEEQASLAGVPDALAEIVDACLAKSPDARPQSVRALAERLAPYSGRPMETSTPHLAILFDLEEDRDAQSAPSLAAPPKLPELPIATMPAPQEAVTKPVLPAPATKPVLPEAATKPALPEPAATKPVLPPTKPALATPPPPPARPQARSTPPVAVTLPPPRASISPTTSPRRTGWKIAAALAAAACLTIVAVAATRTSTSRSSAAAQPANDTATATAAQTALEVPPTIELPTAARPLEPMSPAALPVATTARPAMVAPRANAKGTKAAPAPSPPEAAAAAPRATPAQDPQADAPKQPEPKASDDDLRRFLDDRR